MPEGPLRRTLEELDQGRLPDIPEAMVCVDEMVAGIEISVVFNDGNISADWPEKAQRMLLPESRPGCFLEDLHFNPADVPAQPVIEDSAEKIPPGFSRHCIGADTSRPIRMLFNQRQKSQVRSFDLFKKSVDFERVPDIMGVHHAQNIGRNAVLPQKFISAHCLLEGGLSGPGDAVSVVHLPGTVQTEPHGKALCGQKTAPLLIEEGAVGLHAVGDKPASGLMFSLQGHNLPEVVRAQDGWLSPMPGKTDDLIRRRVDVLDNVFLKDFFGHPKHLGFWIEALLLQIITVATGQVAEGAGRLDENLKSLRSFHQAPGGDGVFSRDEFRRMDVVSQGKRESPKLTTGGVKTIIKS